MTRLLCILILIPLGLNAQTFSGKITYKIDYKLNSSSGTTPPSQKEVDFLNDTMLRVDQNSRIGTQSALINFKDSSYTILMNVSGTRIAVSMPKQVLETPSNQIPSIKYKCKSKKIANYKCKLAVLTYPDGSMTEVFYTKKIPGSYNQKFPGLKGYPLSFEIKQEGHTEVYEATEISNKPVGASYYQIPEDYNKMTLEEFQNALSE